MLDQSSPVVELFTYQQRLEISQQVNPTAAFVFEVLTREPTLTQQEVGQRLGISRSAVNHAVSQLREAGIGVANRDTSTKSGIEVVIPGGEEQIEQPSVGSEGSSSSKTRSATHTGNGEPVEPPVASGHPGRPGLFSPEVLGYADWFASLVAPRAKYRITTKRFAKWVISSLDLLTKDGKHLEDVVAITSWIFDVHDGFPPIAAEKNDTKFTRVAQIRRYWDELVLAYNAEHLYLIAA